MNPQLFRGQPEGLFPRPFVIMGLLMPFQAFSQDQWCFNERMGFSCIGSKDAGFCTQRSEGLHIIQSGYVAANAKIGSRFNLFKKWHQSIIPKIGQFAQICSKAKVADSAFLEDVIVLEDADIRGGAEIASDSNGLITTIGPSAVIGRAQIGKGVYIGSRSRIGDHVTIGEGVWIGDDVTVSDYVRISPNTFIREKTVIEEKSVIRGAYIGRNVVIGSNTSIGEAEIGDDVTIAPGVVIEDSSHIIKEKKSRTTKQRTKSPKEDTDQNISYSSEPIDQNFILIFPMIHGEPSVKLEAENFIYQIPEFLRLLRHAPQSPLSSNTRGLKRYIESLRKQVPSLNSVRPKCEYCGQEVTQGYVLYAGCGMNDRGHPQYLFQAFHRERCFDQYWEQNDHGITFTLDSRFLPEQESFSPRGRELSSPQLFNKAAELYRQHSCGR